MPRRHGTPVRLTSLAMQIVGAALATLTVRLLYPPVRS